MPIRGQKFLMGRVGPLRAGRFLFFPALQTRPCRWIFPEPRKTATVKWFNLGISFLHVLICVLAFLFSGVQLHAAPQNGVAEPAPASHAPDVETLTLDQAVTTALEGNASVQLAKLEVSFGQQAVAAAKTYRYPNTKLYAFGSQPLSSLNFEFQEGAFGTYGNGVGPIPAQNTNISSGLRFTTYIVGRFSQPLTQLYAVKLGVEQQGLAVMLDREKLQLARQTAVRDVKQAYYTILQTQSSLAAAQESINFYTELNRVMTNYLEQKKVLESEKLQVKAQLAKAQVTVLKLQDSLDTQKENLNQLMGRDIRIPYQVEEVPPANPEEENLTAAQNQALAQRPEVREAAITVDQAKLARRQTKAQYIPDVSLTFQYISPFNVAIVPNNIATVGLELSWEPIDWGRRRHELAEDDIRTKQASVSLTDTEHKVLVNVNSSYRNLQETRSQLAAAEADQAAAREKLRETMNQFQEKTVQLKDTLQQQTAVSEANAAYQKALSDFWTARAAFEEAIGEDK
jgi:outer membrane protein